MFHSSSHMNNSQTSLSDSNVLPNSSATIFHSATTTMVQVKTLKLIFIPVILLINLLAGLLPFLFLRRRQQQSAGLSRRLHRLLSLANCFSSGVFLATCFVGLLPNVDAKFRRLFKQRQISIDYPIPEVTLCVGFFLVWLFDITVHSCVHRFSSSSAGVIGGHGHSHSGHDQDLQSSHLLMPTEDVIRGGVEVGSSEMEELMPVNNHKQHHGGGGGEHNHSHLGSEGGDSSASLLKSIMLTVALGSHSTLEGLGFGLLDTTDQITNMAVAMALHESLCALSLGINLAGKVKRICPGLSLLTAFSVLIPIGIVVGLLVDLEQSSTTAGPLIAAALQGLVAGTFLYVVFCEILPAEIAVKTDSLWKVVATALGFSCIALIRFVQGRHKG